ncbi:tubulin polyglutamylase TTLL4-like isoform X1 [Amphibalanus amphitrite]|uniref:tubulin polyglutamylase TTLL4-like isoform X1 n=1 Tax=Amphibalanus amphitrite TaxID=1232801 RepID=UPI001C91F951|nr:tubulin polyglutamylase TTLL4-like isoform X1 [Amphibalanus amphitrite]
MSASVVTCIGCLQCGATCGQCASRARSELALPAAGIPVCLKPRVPGCSVRLAREPRVSGSAPQLGPAGRPPAPLAALAPSTRPAAAEPSARSAGPRAAPTAKDGKRIRDVCDFGDSAKVPEAVTKRKKDDQPAATAATLDGPSAEPEMDDRPEAAASNGVGDPPAAAPSPTPVAETPPPPAPVHSPAPAPVHSSAPVPVHSPASAQSPRASAPPRLLYQPTQPPSFLDSDPASVLRNVGVAQPVEREPRTKAKTGSAPAEKADTSKADSYSDSDLGSDEDDYSDISDLSDPENADDSSKANPFADGDDSASDYEDNHSVMSGMTVASVSSLTPSLVGETLGGISLTETPAAPGTDLPALHLSLFPHVPPTINFCQYNEKTEDLPAAVKRLLRWRLSTITPQLVRQTITNSGLRLTKRYLPSAAETPNWVGTWGKHMKAECFKAVRDFQKVNHFPGTFQIGRKDKLWKNISALQIKFGKNDFGFVPRTYVLPTDLKELKVAWRRDGGKRKWIIKPPACARGTGIRVIQRWSQLPKKKQLIVQRYVSRPYLIEDRKFDLRIYVYVTSFHPLRVYIHDDGLVRFASVKYSNVGKTLSDRFMHLTNYSINKNSDAYQPNNDAELCQGHKWTLKVFWAYMRERGVDTDALWRRIIDMVLKTLIAGEHHILSLSRQHVVSNYCCHELFGFDVLLDEKLRPWLLEVNISPSLHSAAPVDLSVKGPLVRDLFNMAGFHVPNKLSAEQQREVIGQLSCGEALQRLVLDKRLYTSVCSQEERTKQTEMLKLDRTQYLTKILECLTPDDVRHLVRSEDELSKRGGFVRIFPTASTHHYHQYFDKPRYYNRLLDAWETKYGRDREQGRGRLRSLCQDKYHLHVPSNYLRRKTFTAEVVAAAEAARKAALLAATSISTPAAARTTKSSSSLSASRTVSSDSGLSSMETETAGRPRPRTAAGRPSLTARPGYKSLPALKRARPARPPSTPAPTPVPVVSPDPAAAAILAASAPVPVVVLEPAPVPVGALPPTSPLRVQGQQIEPCSRPGHPS